MKDYKNNEYKAPKFDWALVVITMIASALFTFALVAALGL